MDNSANSSSERVSLDQVLRVAELAQLELTPDEQTEMLRDLNSILGHVAQLNELDTKDVPAMAQVKEILGTEISGEHADGNAARDGYGEALRSDTPRPSLNRKEVMAAAPETDGIYFKVPKVIER